MIHLIIIIIFIINYLHFHLYFASLIILELHFISCVLIRDCFLELVWNKFLLVIQFPNIHFYLILFIFQIKFTDFLIKITKIIFPFIKVIL